MLDQIRENTPLTFLLIVLLAAGSVTVGGMSLRGNTQAHNPQSISPTPTATENTPPQKGLQLYTFNLPTPTPTSTVTRVSSSYTNYCSIDSGTPMSDSCSCPTDKEILTCKNTKCVTINGKPCVDSCPFFLLDTLCMFRPDGNYCVGKPVIYLYPTRTMAVHVGLTIPGVITTSIPTYPQGGWDVVAHPGGNLTYNGKTYSELYYESAVNKVNPPESGLVIPVSQLQEKLLLYTHQLGLLPQEQEEFLAYWMPKLEALHAPYIQFSVLNETEKERVDHVDVSPTPDTRIEFLVYFKPLQTDVTPLKPLLLPQTPPKRVGFTEVEWGGTIGN